MKLYEVLDKLQYEVENASGVLLTNKIMLDKDEVLDIIDELRSAVPAEIKEAKRVIEDENRIRQQAKREANNMIKDAKAQKQHLIETNNITKHAYEEADSILREAKAEANRLRVKSIEYITNLFTSTQDELRNVIATIDANKSELKDKKKALNNIKNVE